tara:strand:+ start:1579 stop:2652 length:1074 start_codon:yes stop_codon:yes gene_type:complete
MPALRHASISNNTKTIIISGNPTNTKIISEAKVLTGITQFSFIDIPVPFRYKFNNYKGKIYPPVYTRIKKIAAILKKASAIISTSHELPKHLDFYKIKGPTLFYLYHGTGTREYGFENKLKDFDYILAPGTYHKERLKKTLLVTDEKINIVGTPKSDWIKLNRIEGKNLFNNESHIFYYVPHWDLKFSSYLKWRKVILNYFISNEQYNLIFAPHPLIKHLSKKEGYKIESNLKNANNIIVDHGGKNSIDGTYSSLADIYIGDISSIVTEWILQKPRPCIFINAHGKNWENNDDYYMWKFGSVISDFNDFENVVKKSISSNNNETVQKKLRDKLIQPSSKSASDLCAEFIANKIISLE